MSVKRLAVHFFLEVSLEALGWVELSAVLLQLQTYQQPQARCMTAVHVTGDISMCASEKHQKKAREREKKN